MGAGPDLTRYFAIRRRNLGEDGQEGFDEIEKADCLEKRRVRERRGEERRDECLQPLMVEERNRVGCTNFVRSTYILSEVTPTPTWQIPSIPHVEFLGHVHPRTGSQARGQLGRTTLKASSPHDCPAVCTLLVARAARLLARAHNPQDRRLAVIGRLGSRKRVLLPGQIDQR